MDPTSTTGWTDRDDVQAVAEPVPEKGHEVPVSAIGSAGRSDRDPYLEVGAATRRAHELMRQGCAKGIDWRVFSVISDYTAARSRLEDRIPKLAFEEAGIFRWDLEKSRERLLTLGAIRYVPSGGRAASVYGLPLAQPAGDTRTVAEPARDTRSVAGPTGRDATVQPAGHTRPIREEQSEKAAAADAEAHEGGGESVPQAEAPQPLTEEPDGFAALLEGVPLHGAARATVQGYWRDPDDRERVESCVGEWRRRQAQVKPPGPPVLARMVEDGDDYRGRKPSPVASARRWVDAVAAQLSDEDFEALLADRELTDKEAAEVRRHRTRRRG